MTTSGLVVKGKKIRKRRGHGGGHCGQRSSTICLEGKVTVSSRYFDIGCRNRTPVLGNERDTRYL